uniref:SH3 domain-containing protein n=1 Tax=Ascaris lumbricoides TaxID=6252 RepID=A0A9J2PBT7_ASCLU
MTKKKSDDYGLSNGSSDASLDAALTECINNIADIPPDRVGVADSGFNLLRAFHNVQKMSEAYVKSIDTLADSGSKAFAAARQRAADLKEFASAMREINRRHSEMISKFNEIITKINTYGQHEKDKLKELHRALEKFYVKERNLALMQQNQRYKFFVEKHSEWLRDYLSLFEVFKQIFDESNGVNAEAESENEARGEIAVFDDEGYVAPGAYSEKADSFRAEIHSHNDSTHEPIPNNDAFFNENFVIQHAESEKETPTPLLERSTSPAVVARYRETKHQPQTADKATCVTYGSPLQVPEEVKFKDAATTTTPYENYPFEPLESPAYVSARPSSFREEMTQPLPAVRRNISDRIASLSMTALNETPNSHGSSDKEAIFRSSNINAVPTAFVQQPFMASDYGKLLTCIHNFRAQTADQLSLRSGEKVVLIKCGSKGWIFAKHDRLVPVTVCATAARPIKWYVAVNRLINISRGAQRIPIVKLLTIEEYRVLYSR